MPRGLVFYLSASMLQTWQRPFIAAGGFSFQRPGPELLAFFPKHRFSASRFVKVSGSCDVDLMLNLFSRVLFPPHFRSFHASFPSIAPPAQDRGGGLFSGLDFDMETLELCKPVNDFLLRLSA